MDKLRKALYILISIIAVIVAVGSILSVFSNTENRYLKMLDFPRLQFFILSAVSLVLLIILNRKWRWHDYLLALCLLIGIGIQSSYLFYYTELADYHVPNAGSDSYSKEDEIGSLMAVIAFGAAVVIFISDSIPINIVYYLPIHTLHPFDRGDKKGLLLRKHRYRREKNYDTDEDFMHNKLA
jgi:hypothetical protein